MKKLFFLLSLVAFATCIAAFPGTCVRGATMKNMAPDNGTLISGFENMSDWTVSGTGAIEAVDKVHVIEGSQSIVLIGNMNAAYATKAVSLNLSANTAISFWVYIGNYNNLDSFSVFLSSSPSFSKYFQLTSGISELVPGWNHMVMSKKAFVNNGGDSWNSTMTRIRFRITPRGGTNVSASLDDLSYNSSGKAKCVITFDDNFDSTYNIAKPIMDALGQRGVAFIVSGYVGDGNRHMTLAQMKELYGEGWDMADHSKDHMDLATLSASQLDAEVNGGYAWLAANGFGKSAIFFAYPYGSGVDNSTVISKIRENHVLARSVKWATYQALPTPSETDPLYTMESYNVFNDTKLSDFQTQVDRTIDQKGLIVLTYHMVVNTGANTNKYYTLTSDFVAEMDYLANKTSGIDVITFSDMVDYSNPATNGTNQTTTTSTTSTSTTTTAVPATTSTMPSTTSTSTTTTTRATSTAKSTTTTIVQSCTVLTLTPASGSPRYVVTAKVAYAACKICDYKGCNGSNCAGSQARTGSGTFAAPGIVGSFGYYSCPGSGRAAISVK